MSLTAGISPCADAAAETVFPQFEKINTPGTSVHRCRRHDVCLRNNDPASLEKNPPDPPYSPDREWTVT